MSSEMMAADDVLAVGQVVHLYPAGVPDGAKTYLGKILDIQADFLAVTMEMAPSEYLNAPAAGDMFHCAVTGDNCVYRFDTAFRSSASLPDLIWYINRPLSLERQQNRRFVRVPAPLPMRVKLMNERGGFKNAADTVMVDISGNGICFISLKEALVNTRVFVEVPDLPIIGTLAVEGVVRRCASIEVPTGQIYHVGAYLQDGLSASQQDKLIRSVFFLQRKYLERGMGI